MKARASGIPYRLVVGKHVLKNSATPIVTVFGLQVGRILGSAVIVERVFAMPGFGSLAFTSVQQRDIPMVQGVVLVSALVVIITNLFVDISYPFFNPRLRT
jgi:peptide/nickel transport system permease protein